MTKDDEPVFQAAALPFRERKICLVTTSSGKGLIIPKGKVPEGIHPARLAAREAWEEAGIVGRISRQPFGRYTFMKAGHEHTVQVYLLAVTEWARAWPEQGFRKRLWCSVESAIQRVSHVELRSLLEQFAESRSGMLAGQALRKSA